VIQGVVPEFKPEYHKRQTNKKNPYSLFSYRLVLGTKGNRNYGKKN
jgi:hypothetical protein